MTAVYAAFIGKSDSDNPIPSGLSQWKLGTDLVLISRGSTLPSAFTSDFFFFINLFIFDEHLLSLLNYIIERQYIKLKCLKKMVINTCIFRKGAVPKKTPQLSFGLGRFGPEGIGGGGTSGTSIFLFSDPFLMSSKLGVASRLSSGKGFTSGSGCWTGGASVAGLRVGYPWLG